MKIGLFFGSFNPIHLGHLAMANYFTEFTDLERIWLVISPQSPFKNKNNLLEEHHRYNMAQLALEGDIKIRPSNIEFQLPRPSYTIDTLTYISENYPDHSFHLILGSDNLTYLHQWKNFSELIRKYSIYVYPRSEVDPSEYAGRYQFKIVNAPLIEISSSFIRNSIKQGKDVRYFLPAKVYKYLKDNHFYEK
ncbi:MAG: nicotinate (nicotinamide) nucleotide adenylyltransferase [Bacteroidota bacterium]